MKIVCPFTIFLDIWIDGFIGDVIKLHVYLCIYHGEF